MKVNTDNLHLATEQDVFDTVATHLLTQNQRSTDEHGDCLYRSPDGKMCAAGCLITDQSYQEEIENCSWGDLVRHGDFSENHFTLIFELQVCHDYTPCTYWPVCLKKIANKFDLNTSVLNNF